MWQIFNIFLNFGKKKNKKNIEITTEISQNFTTIQNFKKKKL